jgi:hypothetical protein
VREWGEDSRRDYGSGRKERWKGRRKEILMLDSDGERDDGAILSARPPPQGYLPSLYEDFSVSQMAGSGRRRLGRRDGGSGHRLHQRPLIGLTYQILFYFILQFGFTEVLRSATTQTETSGQTFPAGPGPRQRRRRSRPSHFSKQWPGSFRNIDARVGRPSRSSESAWMGQDSGADACRVRRDDSENSAGDPPPPARRDLIPAALHCL